MPASHSFVSTAPVSPDPNKVGSAEWNAPHVLSVVNNDVSPTAGIAESKLSLNYPTHAALTLNVTPNGLGLLGQELSLGLASNGVTGALSGVDWATFNGKQDALTADVDYLTPATAASTYQPIGSYLTVEVDPVFTGSPAFGIGALDISNWNAKPDGTGATGQVGYWSGTNTLTGSANFTWDETTKSLTLAATDGGITYIRANDVIGDSGTSLTIKAGASNSSFGGVLKFLGSRSGSGITSGNVQIQIPNCERPGHIQLLGGSASGNYDGTYIELTAGNGFNNGQGGNLNLESGQGGANGDGGDITLTLGKKGAGGIQNGRFRLNLTGGYYAQFAVNGISGADTNYDLPNKSGTMALTSDIPSLPLSPANGGTGVNNGTNALTVPATGTAALLGTANVFTEVQAVQPYWYGSGTMLKSALTTNPTYEPTADAFAIVKGLNASIGIIGNTHITGYAAGLVGTANYGGTGTLDELDGLNFLVNNLSTGTIGTSFGIFTGINNALGGTITNAVLFKVYCSNLGTIHSLTGVYLPDIVQGDTSNYAIYTNLGQVYHGDNVVIVNGHTDRSTLLVRAITSQTASILSVQESGNGNVVEVTPIGLTKLTERSFSGENEVLRITGGNEANGPKLGFNAGYGHVAYPDWQLFSIETYYNSSEGGWAGNTKFKLGNDGGPATLTAMDFHQSYVEMPLRLRVGALPTSGIDARLVLAGNSSDVTDGPSMSMLFTGDQYPAIQWLNYAHDNLTISFDSYYSGGWKSSDAGSNFSIQKFNDRLDIKYDSGVAAGSATTMKNGISLLATGTVVLIDTDISAHNLITDTSTGTKIGTAINQKIGFWNHEPAVRPPAYTPTNVTADRSYDANATTIDELADVLGTLIADLQSIGLVG